VIVGRVEGQQARVNVTFVLADDNRLAVECVVDTGYEGALTVPEAAVDTLGLPVVTEVTAKLADGSEAEVDVCTATIVWDGTLAEVAVLAMGHRPLLGTALLAGRHLGVDFMYGGRVEIERLSARDGQ
jgi:clan AA aspartic protease